MKNVASNGDIKAHVIIGAISPGSPELQFDGSQYYYSYICKGPYSITVKTAKDSLIYEKKWDGNLLIYSRYYQTKLGLAIGATKMTDENALNKVIEQIEYILKNDFVFQPFETEFSLRRIPDDNPAYTNTDKLLGDLQIGVRELGKLAIKPSSNAKIDSSLKKLAIELNRCDFKNKKEVFNHYRPLKCKPIKTTS